ncbi:MAG: GAK system CofD-like protein [Rhodospirillales bacterium]|nr:GAK system CofD-like protein [Rhodospirillales bacterium]
MGKKIQITRTVMIPDVTRVLRYEKFPELGPKVLFFSGGTALNDLSRELKSFTHNSIHIVTPFDSGGSSAVLRDVFDMPAIGDLRSRLMALSDDTIRGNPEIVRLFAYRLPKDEKKKELRARLNALAEGRDPMVGVIKNPMRRLIRTHLEKFLSYMPKNFDLRGASIGNLILASGYLSNERRLDQVLFMFSRLVNVQGRVVPVINQPLHLIAALEDGTSVIGQHRITGKEVSPLKSAISDLSLTADYKGTQPIEAELPRKNRKLIGEAELICYPPGSFYTSLCANFLPAGVGRAIAANSCPKVYAPGLGSDPERVGLSLDQSIFKLLEFLKADFNQDCPTENLLNFVLIDSQNGECLKRGTFSLLRREGIEVIDTTLITNQSKPYYDPQMLAIAIMSLT